MPPLAVNEFTAALGELSAKSGEAAANLVGRIGGLTATEGRQFITDAYPVLLDPFLSASGELTAQWYLEQPAAPLAPGAAAFVPTLAPLPAPDQLAISARWALTQADAEQALRGNAIRQTMNASRDTVIANATAEGVRWVRHAQPNACGFCRMLATRSGADSYASKNSALRVVGRAGSGRTRGTRKTGQKYHDHCKCTAIAVRDGVYDPPDYVQQWEDDYKAARKAGDTSPAAIARAMDVPRIRADRLAAKLAKQLPDLAVEAARLREIAQTALPPSPPVPSSTPTTVADVLASPADEIERITADAMAALEAGDETLADELFGKALKLEYAEQAKVERAAKAKVRRESKREAVDREKQQRVGDLIDQGWRPDEAESEVYGVSVESIRRRDFIMLARASGHSGAGFDELVAKMHAEFVAEQYWKAESATNGVFIKSQYAGKYSGRDLWRVNESTARKIVSEEMGAWLDENGGLISRSTYRQSILDGSSVFDVSMQQDFLR